MYTIRLGIFISILASTITIGCNSQILSAPKRTEPAPVLTVRQPIPSGPRVSGVFSGLLNSDDLVTVLVHDEDGHQQIIGIYSGNGPWEIIVPILSESENYTLRVEAAGYDSQPAAYSIHINNHAAFVVQDNHLGEYASNLDFQFIPNS